METRVTARYGESGIVLDASGIDGFIVHPVLGLLISSTRFLEDLLLLEIVKAPIATSSPQLNHSCQW
jgi:hypothetical protein